MAQRLAGASEFALADASADGALVLLCRRCPPLFSYTSSHSSSAYSPSAGWPEPDYLLFERSQNRSVRLATRVHVGSSHSPPAGVGVGQPLPGPSASSADVPEDENEEGSTTPAGAAAPTGRRALVRVAKLSASGRYLVCHAAQAYNIRTSCVHFPSRVNRRGNRKQQVVN